MRWAKAGKECVSARRLWAAMMARERALAFEPTTFPGSFLAQAGPCIASHPDRLSLAPQEKLIVWQIRFKDLMKVSRGIWSRWRAAIGVREYLGGCCKISNGEKPEAGQGRANRARLLRCDTTDETIRIHVFGEFLKSLSKIYGVSVNSVGLTVIGSTNRPGSDEPGRNTDPQTDGLPVELLTGRHCQDLQRGSQSTIGVVFDWKRCVERHKQSIADVVDDDTAVAADYLCNRSEKLVQQLNELRRMHAF